MLLVEDDHSLRKLVEAASWRRGWSVVCADCASDALALAERLRSGAGRPSLLVTDLNLPDMNGWALAKAIRECLAAPELPILLTSGGWGKSLAADLAQLGPAATFLAKPYEVAELFDLIERFAHGPGKIDISPAGANNSGKNVKSSIDEHMTNEDIVGARCSVAPKDSNVTDSAERA